MRRLLVGGLGVAAIVACSDPTPAPPGPARDAGPVGSEVYSCGEYLVRAVAGCGECHTPRDESGALDLTKWLGGVANRFDLAPDDDQVGAVSAPNLTPYALSSWSDAAIERAIRDGLDANGDPLTSLMPYYVFHNLTDDDVHAIVLYLRTVRPVLSDVPARQPLPFAVTAPALPISDSAIPRSTLKKSSKDFAAAERGRYLAASVGLCMDCHSPWTAGVRSPIDADRLFSGGRALGTSEWGGDASTGLVRSTNLTPDATGLAGWSASDVATAITTGIAPNGVTLCSPMTTHAGASFAGLTPEDATAIATYLTTLPPIASDGSPSCSGAGPALPDAGENDAGDDASDTTDAAADSATDSAIDGPADGGSD